MSKSARLRPDDLHAAVELVQDCRDVGDDPNIWQALLAEGLGRLAGAALVFAGEAATRGGAFTIVSAGDWGWQNGFDRGALQGLQQVYQLRFHPQIDAYLARPERADGIATIRKDLISDDDWVRSPYFRIVHEPLGFGHNLVCFLGKQGQLENSRVVTMCRESTERRDFTLREKALVQAVNTMIAPLIGGPLARVDEPSPMALPPRVRQAFQSLLEGDSDKQTAARLGISRHTVNQYTKVVFRHFGVSSRPELLARWIRRGWNAKCVWLQE